MQDLPNYWILVDHLRLSIIYIDSKSLQFKKQLRNMSNKIMVKK